MPTELWAVIFVIIGSVISSAAPILLKKAPKINLLHLKSLIKNYLLFGAIFLHASGIGFTIVALKGGELSILYPLSSLGNVWAAFLSIKFLGEKMNISKWSGIFLIILGAALIGIGS